MRSLSITLVFHAAAPKIRETRYQHLTNSPTGVPPPEPASSRILRCGLQLPANGWPYMSVWPLSPAQGGISSTIFLLGIRHHSAANPANLIHSMHCIQTFEEREGYDSLYRDHSAGNTNPEKVKQTVRRQAEGIIARERESSPFCLRYKGRTNQCHHKTSETVLETVAQFGQMIS